MSQTNVEIERKFLIRQEAFNALSPLLSKGETITQGYLLLEGQKSVRVRLKGDKAYLTLKAPLDEGLSLLARTEFEYVIPLDDGLAMIDQLSNNRLIHKTRRTLTLGDYIWEIDVFGGKHQGLIIAEIELPSEDASFDRPAWLGAEVSEDPRFLNTALAMADKTPAL